ncbi:MAG: zinc-ribbon domain-containing protein [Alphaproteobacteria bacterium]|nr:zinc-ribbon domain-containing protein [Alphaproteobacteria bacterium]
MRVTCPNCESKFKVPDKALGATGRKLRCGSCEHQWFQKPRPAKAKKPAEETAPDDSELDSTEDTATDGSESDDAREGGEPVDHDAGSDDMEPPPIGDISRFRGFASREEKKRPPIALVVLIVMTVAIPSILFAARASLVEAWPASALLYDTLGLHVAVSGEGLVLRNVSVHRRQEGSVEILVVEGHIRNPTDQLVSLPGLRGTVLDGASKPLQEWLFQAEALQLLPNESTTFASEFAGPAPGAAQVNVTFSAERPETSLGY